MNFTRAGIVVKQFLRAFLKVLGETSFPEAFWGTGKRDLQWGKDEKFPIVSIF